LRLLDGIERVMRKLAPGPAPSFNEAHVIKALEIIGGYRSVGRIKLSREVGLGEGTTRTLLKHLKNEGIIKSSRKGISLSDEGKSLFYDLRDKLSEGIQVPSSRLTVGPFNVAILVGGSAQAVKSGMEQRDVAIKSGASGATTLVFSDNKLSMPTREEDISVSMPSLHEQLLTMFRPKENDVIIVGSGENRELAEIGAKMAAFRLLRNTN
jgi:predicted transcriptional regulator